MAKVQQTTVDLLGTTVNYGVKQSDDASEPRIDIDIHGITVVVPAGSEADPTELLKENATWVLDKKSEYEAYREQIPDRIFEEGATFQYLGEDHTVVVEQCSSSEVADGVLRLAKHHVEETSIKRALETLYRRKARETFDKRATQYADEMDVEFNKIEIRNQRTKWGSCSTSGTLGLNWRLMMAPIEMVDYIIIHELAHLREPDHGDSFWSLVAEYDPEYEKHARWLTEHSAELVFSKQDI
jgi:predicted metal-dependent hydrolase